MNSSSVRIRALLSVLSVVLVASACSPAPKSGPVAIEGTSEKFAVRGSYEYFDFEQVDGFTLKDGKILIQGPMTASTSVDLPPGATAEPRRGDQWALTTEVEDRRKPIQTFMHEQSLDDFSLTLPLDGAELKYGTLAGTAGDVVVLAWGKNGRCYHGYVTVTPKQAR